MSIDDYAKRFTEIKPKYEKLGVNVKQALESLLQENDISYLSINYRVKEQNSFLGKIERKKYENPFIQTEDICGIRIICYFQNDIEKIQKIIKNEFDVYEEQSKQELLNATEFGYRSTHLIASVKKEWASTPTFRGIVDFKFEIQVRTILMHSWAEIEHKLAYKSESDIPKELRRKFSFISAILEAADTQFEEIKDRIDDNKKKLIADAEQNQRFDDSVELNLDNLQAFLDYAFKGRKRDINQTQRILNEMFDNEISFPDLVKGFLKYKNVLPRIEEKDIQNLTPEDKEYFFGDANSDSKILWAQSGAVRILMMLINEKYRNSIKFLERAKFIEKYLIKD
jgi:ppGpp synthetase/RelA/SpoT-type nucleotidyltranferase